MKGVGAGLAVGMSGMSGGSAPIRIGMEGQCSGRRELLVRTSIASKICRGLSKHLKGDAKGCLRASSSLHSLSNERQKDLSIISKELSKQLSPRKELSKSKIGAI
jgi:hypothetical protein